MNTKKTVALGVVIIIILAGLTWAIVVYYPSINNNQPQDTYVPTLRQDLQIVDNRTNSHAPFLHVTGTIQNTGNGTANNITIHVYAIQSGNATAIDTSRGLASIAAGTTQTIDQMFSYTGEALVAYYEPTLDWTN